MLPAVSTHTHNAHVHSLNMCTYTSHTHTHTPGRLIGAISCPVGVDGGKRKVPGNCGEGMATEKKIIKTPHCEL